MDLALSLQPFASLGKMSVDTCHGMASGPGSGLLPLETGGSPFMLGPLSANLGIASLPCQHVDTWCVCEGLALIQCLKLSPVIPFLCL